MRQNESSLKRQVNRNNEVSNVLQLLFFAGSCIFRFTIMAIIMKLRSEYEDFVISPSLVVKHYCDLHIEKHFLTCED